MNPQPDSALARLWGLVGDDFSQTWREVLGRCEQLVPEGSATAEFRQALGRIDNDVDAVVLTCFGVTSDDLAALLPVVDDLQRRLHELSDAVWTVINAPLSFWTGWRDDAVAEVQLILREFGETRVDPALAPALADELRGIQPVAPLQDLPAASTRLTSPRSSGQSAASATAQASADRRSRNRHREGNHRPDLTAPGYVTPRVPLTAGPAASLDYEGFNEEWAQERSWPTWRRNRKPAEGPRSSSIVPSSAVVSPAAGPELTPDQLHTIHLTNKALWKRKMKGDYLDFRLRYQAGTPLLMVGTHTGDTLAAWRAVPGREVIGRLHVLKAKALRTAPIQVIGCPVNFRADLIDLLGRISDRPVVFESDNDRAVAVTSSTPRSGAGGERPPVREQVARPSGPEEAEAAAVAGRLAAGLARRMAKVRALGRGKGSR
ncbi:hypothetical protein AB0M48_39020 [Lentzea sp. NPDC051208]|uniref:hypothetical protein n=1 Tax=Lentzea sp. NPDC051208 TaxID=3154642 RepID=UPI003441816B